MDLDFWKIESMLSRDSILVGVILGIIFPVVGYAILFYLKEALTSIGVIPQLYSELPSTMRTMAVLAICFNLILIQIFNNRRYEKAIRGLVFPTMIFVIIWFILYGRQLLGQF